MTHEYYVSFETAKLLKEAGFDWEVEFFYQDGILTSVLPDELFNGNFEDLEYYYKHIGIPHRSLNYNGGIGEFIAVYSAPTLDKAQRWLREVKKFEIIIERNFKRYQCRIEGYYKEDDTLRYQKWVTNNSELFETYEEAQEAGIKKALELILEKGE